MPGLVDAHVHLEGRKNFGDAPLFLASGVTTVLNLRGFPELLKVKQEIAEGKLLAPNLYTSGEFINEPSFNTPEEVEHEVVRQKSMGYDVIKFHEIVNGGRYVTTHGLSRAAYDALNSTARRIGIPLIGHAPDNLGLQALLDDHQSLAHSGILVALYFVPKRSLASWGLLSLICLGLILLSSFVVVACGIVCSLRRGTFVSKRAMALAVSTSAASLLFVGLWPGYGLLSGSLLFLIPLSILALLILGVFVALSVVTIRSWTQRRGSVLSRGVLTVVSLASLGFCVSLAYWLPVAWRTSDANLERVSKLCSNAGIWVEPTLVIYQNIELMREGRSNDLLAKPVMRYVPPEIRTGWSGIPSYHPPFSERLVGYLFRKTLLISERTTGALQRNGVPLMLGTDSFGFPFCIPGESAHDELQLLLQSGLTPYQALQSATSAPARFLGKESEFGTVTVGKRADLLLVDQNPFTDLETTRRPAGVMIRGVWLSSGELQRSLDTLAN